VADLRRLNPGTRDIRRTASDCCVADLRRPNFQMGLKYVFITQRVGGMFEVKQQNANGPQNRGAERRTDQAFSMQKSAGGKH
jgi:hypothetical protein